MQQYHEGSWAQSGGWRWKSWRRYSGDRGGGLEGQGRERSPACSPAGGDSCGTGGEGEGRLWFGRGLRDSAAHATSQHSGHGRVGKHLASGERKSGVLSRETVFVAGVTVGWAYPGTGSGWRSDPGDPPVTGGHGEEHPQRGRGVCEEEPAASLAAEGSRPMRTENGPAGARWASLAGWGQGQAMLHGAENGGCT